MIIKGMSFMNYKKFKEATELSLEQFAKKLGLKILPTDVHV